MQTFLFLLLVVGSAAFSPSAVRIPAARLSLAASRPAALALSPRAQMRAAPDDNDGGARPAATRSAAAAPPAIVFKLNAATKWVVVAAQTAAVWSRRDFVAPFIVVGSIGATWATGQLKKLFNQARPAGAPFADPGMPSSHALVATFAAVGWATHLESAGHAAERGALLAGAALVSWLRVACGYHTTAQVGRRPPPPRVVRGSRETGSRLETARRDRRRDVRDDPRGRSSGVHLNRCNENHPIGALTTTNARPRRSRSAPCSARRARAGGCGSAAPSSRTTRGERPLWRGRRTSAARPCSSGATCARGAARTRPSSAWRAAPRGTTSDAAGNRRRAHTCGHRR